MEAKPIEVSLVGVVADLRCAADQVTMAGEEIDTLRARHDRAETENEAWRSGRLKRKWNGKTEEMAGGCYWFTVFNHEPIAGGGERMWTDEFPTIDEAVDALMAEEE